MTSLPPPADPGRSGLVVLAVDDEAPALDEISYLLGRDPRVGAVRTAANATAALAALQPDADGPVPDAVLLDIAMPGWDGIDLARMLSGLPHRPAVAFLSAHDDRAVDAYEIGAVDYLLKPVRPARLAEAVGRLCAARDRADPGAAQPSDAADRPSTTPPTRPGPVGSSATPPTRPGPGDERGATTAPRTGPVDDRGATIAVDLAGTTTLVPRSAVCWAEAQGDYARLQMAGGTSHLLRTPLSVLQEEWEPAGFVRVHRSYLVALDRIVELRSGEGGHRIRVTGQGRPADLPVSRRHLRELKERLLAGRRPGRRAPTS